MPRSTSKRPPRRRPPSASSPGTLQQYGHRTLADILNSVRGFYVSYDRAYRSIGVRGFNRPGDFGGRMLLMVDGHRLNDGVYDTAASGTESLDVDLIERVEVIRETGSWVWQQRLLRGDQRDHPPGDGALKGRRFPAPAGSWDTWSGRVSYGQRFTNGVELAVSGTLADSAGRDRLGYPEFVAEDLDGGWARNVFASVSYQGLSLQGGLMHRQKDWPTAAYDTVPNSQDPRLFTGDERAWADLTFRHEFGDEWLVAARGYFDRYQFEGEYPYDYDTNPLTRPSVNRDLARATSAGLDLSVNKALGDSHRVTAGENGVTISNCSSGTGRWTLTRSSSTPARVPTSWDCSSRMNGASGQT